MRAISKGRARFDPNQLDLFSFTPTGVSLDETVNSIWPHGRETLAPVPAEDGPGTGSLGTAAHHAPGSGGSNGEGNGSSAPILPTAGIKPTAGARPGLGNGPGALHLPPARNVGASQEEEASASSQPLSVAEPEPVRNQNNYRI